MLEIKAAIESIASQIPGLCVPDYGNLTVLHGKLLWQDENGCWMCQIPILCSRNGPNWRQILDDRELIPLDEIIEIQTFREVKDLLKNLASSDSNHQIDKYTWVDIGSGNRKLK